MFPAMVLVLAVAAASLGMAQNSDDAGEKQNSVPEIVSVRTAPGTAIRGEADGTFSDDEDVNRFRRAYVELLRSAAGLRTSEKYSAVIKAAAVENRERKFASIGGGMVRTLGALHGMSPAAALTSLQVLTTAEDETVRAAASQAMRDLPVYTTANLGGERCYMYLPGYFGASGWTKEDSPFPEDLIWFIFVKDRDAALNSLMMAISVRPEGSWSHHKVAQETEAIRHEFAVYHTAMKYGEGDGLDPLNVKIHLLQAVKPRLKALRESGLWYARAWAADLVKSEMEFMAPEELAPFQRDERPVVRRLSALPH